MSEIIIRQAKIGDAEMLAKLSYQTFWDAFHEHPKNAPEDMAGYMAQAFSVEQIGRELDDPNSIFLLAEIDSEPAGYAKLLVDNVEEPIKGRKPVELCRLYSKTEFIGKGVGQILMDECFRVAVKLNCDIMWLGVWEYNPRACRFYEKQGFEVVGTHIFQLGSDAQTDFLMQKSLDVDHDI